MSDMSPIDYSGERYEATVPDTLDLAQRAELAINGIGGTIDPESHHEMFFKVQYACKTPYMEHHAADTTCDPKYSESFPLMRIMCGSEEYAGVEDAQMIEMLSRMDGGLYWNRVDPTRPWRLSYNPAFDGSMQDEDLCNVGGNGRMLRALVTWREVSGDPAWDRPIRDLVNGLTRIAVSREDYRSLFQKRSEKCS